MKSWAEGFYKSDNWQKTRTAYLKSQHYICERCGMPAKVVHHRKWLTRDNIGSPYISLCWDNLEAVCQDCHNREHHRGSRTARYRYDSEGNIILPPIN